jgi:hypothetical protein
MIVTYLKFHDMPYYFITIHLPKRTKPLSGIRESTIKDVDAAWLHFKRKTEKEYPGTQLKRFNLVMLSRHSQEVIAYLEESRRPPIDGLNTVEKVPD